MKKKMTFAFLIAIPFLQCGSVNSENAKATMHSRKIQLIAGETKLNATLIEYGESTTVSNVIKLPLSGSRFKLTIPYRAKYFITLPNGATAWVNSGTSFLFNPECNHIELSGEAYIESKQPLTISAGNYTAYLDSNSSMNINNYNDFERQPLLIAIFVKGSRGIIKSPQSADTLTTCQTLIVYDNRKTIRNDYCTALSWMSNDYVFVNIDPDLLFKRIARWYGKDLEIKGVCQYRFVSFEGSYTATLTETLDKLKKFHCSYELQRNKIIINNLPEPF